MAINSTHKTETSAAPKTPLDNALDLVSSEMAEVDRCINDNLNSDVALINQLGAYIIQAGGKRLRPVALLLVAKAVSAHSAEENTVSQHAITLAAIVEFIHTATLLHDDVVDESELRRGRETANEVFGNAASVLVGDYLYSRSFQMMVKIHNLEVMALLSRTTNAIAEGEVMQLLNCGSSDTTEEQYLDTIQSKTAILFAAATQLGALITNQSQTIQDSLYQYGLHLGTAFQLVDDVLDYTADAATMGKNVGDDLAEGKPTLPIIHAIEHTQGKDKATLIEAIENGNRDNLEKVLSIIGQTRSLEYTSAAALEQCKLAKKSIEVLPDSRAKQALNDIVDFSVDRVF